MASRQRRWQLKQRDNGRCMICGRKASRRNRKFCEDHRQVAAYRRRLNYRGAA